MKLRQVRYLELEDDDGSDGKMCLFKVPLSLSLSHTHTHTPAPGRRGRVTPGRLEGPAVFEKPP